MRNGCCHPLYRRAGVADRGISCSKCVREHPPPARSRSSRPYRAPVAFAGVVVCERRRCGRRRLRSLVSSFANAAGAGRVGRVRWCRRGLGRRRRSRAGEWADAADGAPDAIRTRDTRFRRAVLYPLSYQGEQPDIIHTIVHAAQPNVGARGKINRANDTRTSCARIVWNTSRR